VTPERHVIFNADDFGASEGINRAIVDCHTGGVVTSASLMVTGAAAEHAVAISREHPDLSVGLHWDVWGEDEREFDIYDVPAVRAEFARQVEAFRELTGRDPTHVDSHQHAHREDHLMPVFKEMVEPLGVPLRCDGSVHYVGGFYAQWEWKVTNLEYVSVPFLQQMLSEETREGWTEFGCHPGYPSPGYDSIYLEEREVEVRSLVDPRIRATIDELGLRLASYADYLARAGD
jgi:chitin disaccharide deacetylase